jgi:hypothetical protein
MIIGEKRIGAEGSHGESDCNPAGEAETMARIHPTATRVAEMTKEL